jgi:hypothetical protein
MFQARMIRRIEELKALYPVEVMMNASPEVVEEATRKHQEILDEELWSNSQVCELYNISRQNLNNIARRHAIPGRIKFANAVFYMVEFAKPWFDSYVARNGGK